MFHMEKDKLATTRKRLPKIQLLVALKILEAEDGFNAEEVFWPEWRNGARIAGPLYMVTISAPEIETRVPMTLIWPFELFKSSFSILDQTKQICNITRNMFF